MRWRLAGSTMKLLEEWASVNASREIWREEETSSTSNDGPPSLQMSGVRHSTAIQGQIEEKKKRPEMDEWDRRLMLAYLSQRRNVQLAMIQRETMNTRSTVPGQMVIKVFRTNLVLKLMRFRAPILLDDASVNSLLCNNITRQMRYRRRNMGNDKATSTGTLWEALRPAWLDSLVDHVK